MKQQQQNSSQEEQLNATQKQKVNDQEEVKKIPIVQPYLPFVVTLLKELKNDLIKLDKSFTSNNILQIQKIMKQVRKYKKYLKSSHFEIIFNNLGMKCKVDFKILKDFDQQFQEKFEVPKNLVVRLSKNPAIKNFLNALVIIYLFSIKEFSILSLPDYIKEQIQNLNEMNKRYMDNLKAILYFYYSRYFELKKDSKQIRDELMIAYRTTCVHKDEYGQAILLNSLLRNYIEHKDFDLANQLINKTSFPEKFNNEFVRFLYYSGFLKAIQVEYQEAYSRLVHAIRKAPDNTAIGFKIQAYKLSIIVELLLGEIPQRSIFKIQYLQKPLYPYFKVIQSVVKGNVKEFQHILNLYQNNFAHDKVLLLVHRLHHNVIKTGLKRIALSYSQISLGDIAEKLQLESGQVSDTEFIVAKCIKDGVMKGKIDHEKQLVTIEMQSNSYVTDEPKKQFEKRIEYSLELQLAVTKALQFPQQKQEKENENEEEEGKDMDIEQIIDNYFDF